MYKKNTSGIINLVMVNAATGAGMTGLTVSGYRTIDGGAQAAVTGTIAEKGNGQYQLAAAAADLNGDQVGLLFTAAGAVPVHLMIHTTAGDFRDAVRLGLSALPNAAAGATGGLPTRGGAIPDATAGAAGGLPILGTGAGAINPSGGKVPATLAAGDVTGNVKADLDTIKGQAVTAAAAVTFPAAIGTSTYAGGAVASVTGNVGGNVAGSVASVTADVGITQAAADKVWGSNVRTLTTFAFDVTVGGYATGQDPGTLLDGRLDALDAGQATIAGSVAAVVDAVWAKAMTELSSVPGVNATTLEALQWLFLMARNRYEATASTQVLRNDADSATIATSASGDDGYLFTRGKWS